MSSFRLIAVTVLVAVLASIGSDRGAYAIAPPSPACSAAEIMAAEGPSCPASGPCTITKVFSISEEVCVLDFGTRDVTISGSGELRVGTASVTLRAGKFTVAPGGLVEGNTTTVGGSFTVEAARDIEVLKGSATGRIRMSGEEQGGSILLDAGGDIRIEGQLHAHNSGVGTAEGGTITLVAGGDIVTTSTSEIDLHGGIQEGGGSLNMDAGGRIDIGKAIDATGGEGGSINIDAKGRVVIGDKLNTNGTGDGGGGGDVYIVAEMDVEVSGQILNRGTASSTNFGGGDGGAVSITSGFGNVTVRNDINVQGGFPDGGGGGIDISSAFGSIDLESTSRLIAEGIGIESWGGDVTLGAGLDVTVSGAVEASGGDSGGTVTIDAGRHVTLTKIISVRGTTAGSSGGGSVAIEAGKHIPENVRVPGNVTIGGEGEIDLKGGGCDASLGCSTGGDAEITACDITVSGRGIDASAPGNGGEGGEITLSARDQLVINSVLDATGQGGAGSITLVHPSETQPDITALGGVAPAADITACCTELAACDNSTCTGVCSAYCTSLCNCGDNTLDEFEECDGGLGCGIDGEVCAPPWSGSGCMCIDTCGTQVGIQAGEDCDGSDLGGETCFSQGFLGGDKSGGGLGCTENCRFDFSGCALKCGDGFIEPGEACDTNHTIDDECTDVGFCGGSPLSCMDDCMEYDTSACEYGDCGDGCRCAVPGCTTGPGGGPEECDDDNSIDNDSCLNDCTRALCGDGKLCSAADCDTGPDGGAEECDDGNDDNNDACRNDCRAAFCGDGIVCSAANCTSGPGGGPEECEPKGDPCCRSEGCALRTCNGTTCSSTGGRCCPPGAKETCDDGNTCTDDQCDQWTGCSHTQNSASCDDGDACTTGDRCTQGRCTGTSIDGCCLSEQDCDDGNLCTDDACNVTTHQCVNEQKTCETTDRCFVGACNRDDGNCQFASRGGFEFLDCVMTHEQDLAASIEGFAGDLGPKETKRLSRFVAKVKSKIEAASASGQGKKAVRQLKMADQQLRKFLKRLAKLAKKGKGDIAAVLEAQATAIQVSLQEVRAQIS